MTEEQQKMVVKAIADFFAKELARMAAVEIVFTTEDTEESFSKTSVILCVLCGESLSLLLLQMPFPVPLSRPHPMFTACT